MSINYGTGSSSCGDAKTSNSSSNSNSSPPHFLHVAPVSINSNSRGPYSEGNKYAYRYIKNPLILKSNHHNEYKMHGYALF